MSRWVEAVSVLRRDLAVALRGLRRAPASSATVVVTLALGIGANLTMFRVIDRVLLRPPEHVQDADRVVRLFQRSLSPDGRIEFKQSMAYPDFDDLDGASVFAATAAYAFGDPVVGDGEEAERVMSQWATAGLFPLLGVKPAVGRFFTAEEDRAGSPGTAVLAWSYWMRRFGGDHGVLGGDLRIGASSYTVIGVAPPGFTGPSLDSVQVWLPFHQTAAIEAGRGWENARVWSWIHIVARLAPGVSPEVALARANTIKQAAWAVDTPSRERSFVLASLMAAAALIAGWSGQAIERLLLPGLPSESAGQGGRILLFTLATCLLTAVLAGLVPALQAGRRDVADELKAGARTSPPRSRLQDGLVVAQGALSVVLLVFAGLFVKSLQGVESRTHVGIDPGPVVLAQTTLKGTTWSRCVSCR